jgi:ABC-type iron transport system FetAB ATPase subunit
MTEVPSPSSSPDAGSGLRLDRIAFLENGPYSLSVSHGECVGITGPSGAGKTQLLRAVVDVMSHEGECWLDGQACSSVDAPQWRRRVAMVPAESFWWHDTVAPHFASGLTGELTSGRLKKLGFSEDVGGWRISRLSTGERQRLSLIRSLALNPKVLLLDEPTSSLDLKTARLVEEIVMQLCREQDMICLWVSHDLDQLARVSQKTLRLESHGFTEEKD